MADAAGNQAVAARVKTLAGMGTSPADIASLLELEEADLRRDFGRELRSGRIEADAQVAQALFRRATQGAGDDANKAALAWMRRPPGAPVTTAEADAPEPPAPATVNLDQMAALLNVSLPTMRKLIQRYDSLPILVRGSNGTPWQFDPAAVVGFVRERKAEEAASRAEKSELLGQIALPFETGTEAAGHDLGELEKIYRLARAADQLAVSRSQLVDKNEERRLLVAAFRIVAEGLLAQPRALRQKYNLPADVARSLGADNEALLRRFHAEITAACRPLEGPGLEGPALEGLDAPPDEAA